MSVPSAHETAAPSIQAMPAGRPVRLQSSCHSSSAMATLTLITASRTRGVMRSPKKAAPSSTVKMGMVKPRMAARPEASSCTPKMDSVCQPSTLGRPSQAMVFHSRPTGHMRSPLAATYTNNQAAPSSMVLARKYSGDSSCSESFIMGQLTPHMRVRASSAQSWRREITEVIPPRRFASPPWGLRAAAPSLPAQAGTARRSLDSGEAAACKAHWPSGKASSALPLDGDTSCVPGGCNAPGNQIATGALIAGWCS